ncbi:MAG: hypothetical protein U1E27_06250 [Kiritimatiellia bacterium]|nr:hypothetical protein [Kiritimatiellia bacterium]
MKQRIELDETEWGQILDGLSCRQELYEDTVRYYEGSTHCREIAEVSGADEARNLARIYRELIAEIRRQLEAF